MPPKQEVRARLKNLSMPTLVISGTYDFACPHTEWEAVIEEVAVDYQLMKNASHNPQTEKVTEQEFDDILTTWISNTKN